MSNFKIVVTSVFAACIVIGIVLFAMSKNTTSSGSANVLVWGTISSEIFNSAYTASSISQNKDVKVTYIKKDVASFDADFVEALAEGRGPDIVILRDDSLYKQRNKLLLIPYQTFSQRSFKDEFIEEGELFLDTNGVIAVPFIVDPMVMYWNRDMFGNALIAQPPQYWDEMTNLVNKITKRDSNANILQSATAMGEWRNITNAKEIISMLLLQAGTPIVSRTNQGVVSVLNSQFDYPIAPSQSAVNFYTQFSNPTSPTYSWNRSLPSSLNFFLSGNLATYIGFASEIFGIQQKNSNLNFDVTYVPQIRGTTKKSVFAHMYALAISKQSTQVAGAFSVISALTESASLKAIEVATNLPPVRRDLLADRPTDAFRAIFYNSALISHSWIDPDPGPSSNTFRDMIESITGGKSRTTEAINQADAELSAELK